MRGRHERAPRRRRHEPGQPAAGIARVQGGGEGVNADHGSKIEQACSSSLSADYDEPEILRYSNRQFGPIGADAGQSSRADLKIPWRCPK